MLQIPEVFLGATNPTPYTPITDLQFHTTMGNSGPFTLDQITPNTNANTLNLDTLKLLP